MRQPWAWAIIHGGKDVENRTQAWTYRGPLAIHAGAQISERGKEAVPRIVNEQRGGDGFGLYLGANHFSALIGTVDLVDVHVAHDGCCESPWAEREYREAGGRLRKEIAHLVLENPRPLPEPIPARGMLGLWTPPPIVLEQLQAVAQ